MNMRKLTTFVLLLLAVVLHAQQITPDEAAAIASEFLNSSSTPLKGATRVKAKRVMPKSASPDNDAKPYYVFNGDNDQGFVIIAGDKRAKKIIGYSDKGNFDYDNLPPQLSAMLDQFARQVEALPASAAPDPSWDKASRTASNDDGILLPTADWGQGYPYNLLTPIIDGEHCLTGCVATAMAIVMKYNNWPEQAFGENIYYSQSLGDYELFDYNDYSFDFENMSDEVIESDPGTNYQEIAKLMNAVGHSVEMDYAPHESGADFRYVYNALRYHFRYAESCEYISREDYSDLEWEEILRHEIDVNRPVLYAGSGIGKHAFVCDGYKDEFFHINWGWNGFENGYFLLSNLTPAGYSFSSEHCMVIGIQPDYNWQKHSALFVDPGYYWFEHYVSPGHGALISVENVHAGEPFDFSCSYLIIPAGFTGKYGIALVNKEGEIKEIITEVERSQDSFQRTYDYVRFQNCSTTTEPDIDDFIQIVGKSVTDTEWLPVWGVSDASSKVKAKGNNAGFANLKINIEKPSIMRFWNAANFDSFEPGSYEVMIGSTISYICLKNEMISAGYPNHRSAVIVSHNGDLSYNFERVRDGQLLGNVYLENGDYEISAYATELTTKNLTISSPGDLENLIPPAEAIGISSLTLTGPINAKDLKYIKTAFGFLENLDLSETTVESSIEENDRFDGNILPTGAFSGMNYLKYVDLPRNLVKISEKVFADNPISIINIPETVSEIESNAFFNVSDLTDIMVHWQSPIDIPGDVFSYYMNYDGCILYVPIGSADLYKEHPIWSRFVNIEERDDFNIVPVSFTFEGVKYILDPKEFTAEIIGSDSSLPADVQIPAYVKYEEIPFKVIKISDRAFEYSLIETFEMPNTIETLGSSVFLGCTNLRKVNISSAIKVIPTGCFGETPIRNISLPDDLEYIAFASFNDVSLESLHIPAKTMVEENSFYGISSCTSITVDENNPYHKVIDNILYSKDGKNVILVAGGLSGKISLPDDIEKLNSGLFYKMPNLTEIEIPRLEVLPSMFITYCPRIKYITLPDETVSSRGGEFITDCDALESITLGRNFEVASGIHRNPRLTNIYLRNTSVINIPFIFDGAAGYDGIGFYGLNFYTDQIHNNVIIEDCKAFYVPGSVSAQFGTLSDNKVIEMWSYRIDRSNGLISIKPEIDGLVIDNVLINGSVAVPITDCMYKLPQDSDLDVVVDFTLHERQQMTTHYDPDFNAAIPSTDLSLISEITLNTNKITLFTGESAQLTTIILPEIAINNSITWSSSDEEIATVDENGKVTAIAVGEADITVTASDGSDVSAVCHVTVLPILAESIILEPKEWSGYEGESFIITATVLPENTTDPTLSWISSDQSVATVDNEGKVTAIAIGEADITATDTDGSNVSAVCHVTVRPILAESVTLEPTEWSGYEGESFIITATVLPENTTVPTLSWISSDQTVATVDNEGKVTAIAIGEAYITVTATDGSDVSAVCHVAVLPILAESITLNPSEWSGYEGESFTITATVLPENTTDPTLSWTSSDQSVATVDNEGKVTAIAIGEADITVTATDGSDVSAVCHVTVDPPVLAESVTIVPKEWSGYEGESFIITATVLPENTTDPTLSWISSDQSVATIDNEGKVSVLKPGNCVITAYTTDGSDLSADCIITSSSGINAIFADDSGLWDVYNVSGTLIIKKGNPEQLRQLQSGIYIFRQGSRTIKIFIK